MPVPFVLVSVAPMSEVSVAGPYGTTMPAGVSRTWAAAPRVQMPSSARLAMPMAAPSWAFVSPEGGTVM